MNSSYQFPIQHCQNNYSAASADTSHRCLEGHGGGVTALSPLRDRRIASASYDDTIRLWDPTSGAVVAHLNGHGGPVNALCPLIDGRLASGSDDKTIRLWDLNCGGESVLMHGHTGPVWALYPLPGSFLVSISTDNSARLWDLRSGAEIRRLQKSTWITAHCMAKDGRLALASGGLFSSDNAICLWDPRKGGEIALLEGHDRNACRGPAGGICASAGADPEKSGSPTPAQITPPGEHSVPVRRLL